MNAKERGQVLKFLLSLGPPKEGVRDRWYGRSYPILARSGKWKETPSGLVQVMAYAASWVRLIPAAEPSSDQADVNALVEAFEGLDAATAASRRNKRIAVIQCAEKAFGTKADAERIVLLSKALHFFRPGLAPMIDGRVGVAWIGLRDRFPWIKPASIMSGLDAKKQPFPTKTDYMAFWEEASELVQRARRVDPAFSYRVLDQILFHFGKQLDRERRRARPRARKGAAVLSRR